MSIAAVFQSVLVGLLSVLIALLIGVPAAWKLSARQNGGLWRAALAVLPLALPAIWGIAALNSRAVARLLLRSPRPHPRHGYRVIALSVLLMVAFHLALEPYAVSIQGWWTANPSPPLALFSWIFLSLAIQVAITPLLLDKFPTPRPPNYAPLFVWVGIHVLMAMAILCGINPRQDGFKNNAAGGKTFVARSTGGSPSGVMVQLVCQPPALRRQHHDAVKQLIRLGNGAEFKNRRRLQQSGCGAFHDQSVKSASSGIHRAPTIRVQSGIRLYPVAHPTQGDKFEVEIVAVKTGPDGRPAKTHQTKPQSSGRSSAGCVPKIAPQVPRNHVGEARENFLEHFKLIWRHAFLRSKCARRTACSEQGIPHIGRGRHPGKNEIGRRRNMFEA